MYMLSQTNNTAHQEQRKISNMTVNSAKPPVEGYDLRSKSPKTVKLLLTIAALGMVFASTWNTNGWVSETFKVSSVKPFDLAPIDADHWKVLEPEEQVHNQQEAIQKLQETVQRLSVEDTHFQEAIRKLQETVQRLEAAATTTSQPAKAIEAHKTPALKLVEERQSEPVKARTIEAQIPAPALDEARTKDRDAWYGDISNADNLDITIQLTRARNDRLGSNVRLPLYLYAYTLCKGYKFCIKKGREGRVAGIFAFPSCPENLLDFSPQKGDLFNGTATPVIEESGTYSLRDTKLLYAAIGDQDPKCTFPDDFRQQWRDMVLNAVNHPSLNATLTQQDLFSKNKSDRTTTIAVNIRRGDVTNYKRAIWDEVYVKVLQQLRSAVERNGKIPEVHLFSEDYGMIDKRRKIAPNWTLYDGLVDHFHLAPDFVGLMKKSNAMDVSLNMRDWRHFLTADILVVGGSFSEIPAYGRPSTPDPKTGAGLTLYPCASRDDPQCRQFNQAGQYIHGWSTGGGGRMDQLELVNMPESLAPTETESS